MYTDTEASISISSQTCTGNGCPKFAKKFSLEKYRSVRLARFLSLRCWLWGGECKLNEKMSDVNDTVEPGDEASMASVTSDSTAPIEELVEEPVQELSVDEVTLKNVLQYI